jgi:hypothetical protein
MVRVWGRPIGLKKGTQRIESEVKEMGRTKRRNDWLTDDGSHVYVARNTAKFYCEITHG